MHLGAIVRTDHRLSSLALGAYLAVTATPATGATDSLHFGYRQVTGGNYSGTFHAEGTVTDLAAFPPREGGVHATHVSEEGMHTLLIVGGFENDDSSGDVAFLLLQSDEPLAPGAYSIDPGSFSAEFGFVDDAVGVEIPANPSDVDWGAYAAAIVAAHKFIGISGVITLDEVADDYVSGSFAGAMIATDLTMMIAATDASFAAGTAALSVRPASWARIKSEYRD
jgi:hypothetical protein